VGRWRRRYASDGLAGLCDRPRPGRPLVYGHDDRLAVVACVTGQPPDPDSQWTHQAVADRVGNGMSADTVGNILAEPAPRTPGCRGGSASRAPGAA
jgi:hypothetical protein